MPYLSHVFEELITTPPRHVSIVVVLLAATYGKSSVTTRAAAEELASTELDLAVINSRALLRDDVPNCLFVKVLGPPWHVSFQSDDILQFKTAPTLRPYECSPGPCCEVPLREQERSHSHFPRVFQLLHNPRFRLFEFIRVLCRMGRASQPSTLSPTQ